MLSVEFESAVLTSMPDRRTFAVGWFIQALDVNSASTRYRCLHFAQALAPDFQSIYLTSLADAQRAIRELDALIIVKRLDRAVMDLVAMARQYGVPVFLDLCDDLIAPHYSKNELGVNLLHFLGIAPFLVAVTVSSAEMGDRVERYAADHGCSSLQVHVIPDIAETWEIYRATFNAVMHEDVEFEPTGADLEESRDTRRVVWFGNYGASHSNFGMFTLKSTLRPLQSVHDDIPLQLVIVSNNETVYDALTYRCNFPTLYIPWSPSAVYSALATADAALLTTGDDEFCSIKSSNRVLQALAANVPVITAKNAAIAEFEEVIFSGRLEDSLRLCLGPARERTVPLRLAAAQRILDRYTPERLGGIWAQLLQAAIGRSRPARFNRRRGRILFVVERGDRLQNVKAALTAAKAIPGLEYELLMSADLLECEPGFRSVLAIPATIPRFFSGRPKGGRNLLLGFDAMVVDRPSAPVAELLSGYAANLDVSVVTSAEAVAGAFKSRTFRKKESSQLPSGVAAGPYAEWENPDRSVDWSFIVHRNAQGWILDAICREVGSRQPNSWRVCYYPDVSPPAKNYFFSHYLLLESYLERHPENLKGANVFVWYTHPREENPSLVGKRLLAFDHVTKVIFACESNRQIWLERGLSEEKTVVILGAADPKLFGYHERGAGVIGLSSSFYERKNPDLLLEIVKLLPHRKFLLLGRRWNQYALFEEMRALPNFEYKRAAYGDYPEIYAEFDVFLSMSSLEGGPIPLIEAMMSNAVPVASRTGFAPDLIRQGENGFIFDLDASAETVAAMIEAAFAVPGNVRETVERFTWDRFSAEVVKLAG